MQRMVDEAQELSFNVYLDAGALETATFENRESIFDAHKRMSAALGTRAKSVAAQVYNGHHDYACWRATLADGIVALAAKWM